MNLLLILDTILNPVNIDYNCDQRCSEAEKTAHKQYPVEMPKVLAEECGQIARPSDDSYFDFWAKRSIKASTAIRASSSTRTIVPLPAIALVVKLHHLNALPMTVPGAAPYQAEYCPSN